MPSIADTVPRDNQAIEEDLELRTATSRRTSELRRAWSLYERCYERERAEEQL